jgi:hypothetical protein
MNSKEDYNKKITELVGNNWSSLTNIYIMKKIKIVIGLLYIIVFSSCNKPQSYQDSQTIQFVTMQNDIITIKKNGDYHYDFYLNKKLIFTDTNHVYIHPDSLNRIIEGGKGISLFLLIDDSPNFDKILGYQITKDKVLLKAEVCYSGKGGRKDGPAPFTDMDGDGYIEFGGSDIKEVPTSYPDSIYYNPSEFYEIRNGEIFYDKAFTMKMDIAENGLYIEHPLDKKGFCCVVVPNPQKLKK